LLCVFGQSMPDLPMVLHNIPMPYAQWHDQLENPTGVSGGA
jgi:hypothetical protein